MLAQTKRGAQGEGACASECWCSARGIDKNKNARCAPALYVVRCFLYSLHFLYVKDALPCPRIASSQLLVGMKPHLRNALLSVASRGGSSHSCSTRWRNQCPFPALTLKPVQPKKESWSLSMSDSSRYGVMMLSTTKSWRRNSRHSFWFLHATLHFSTWSLKRSLSHTPFSFQSSSKGCRCCCQSCCPSRAVCGIIGLSATCIPLFLFTFTAGVALSSIT
mmetsp:Transcript_53956/g.110100  ORF Transcript_53956/g.110100 Transcript_53956/m.110100 type:complete len:220 (-) Transcript_53956:582-1241(-)